MQLIVHSSSPTDAKPFVASSFCLSKNDKNNFSKSVVRASDIDKDGAPPGRRCISFDAAIEIIAPLIPSAAKHQKERAKEAIAGLVCKGVIGQKGDWLWAK